MVLVMVVLTTGMTAAQEGKTFEGVLTAVDAKAHVLTLKEGDKEMQFTYSEQTELVAPQKNNQDVAVKQGSRLKISYVENAGKNVATKIEIIEV
jgi:hypothetical protein